MLCHQGMKLCERIRRIRRCGLLKGNGLLGAWTLRFQKPIPGSVCLCLLPVDQDVKLAVTAPQTRLPVSRHDGSMSDSKTASEAPINVPFPKSRLGHGAPPQQQNTSQGRGITIVWLGLLLMRTSTLLASLKT